MTATGECQSKACPKHCQQQLAWSERNGWFKRFVLRTSARDETGAEVWRASGIIRYSSRYNPHPCIRMHITRLASGFSECDVNSRTCATTRV